jgi:hypothetical protein
MPTSVKNIVTAAYARSTKNKPGTIATEATELLGFFQSALQAMYAVAARVNPTYFGKIAQLTFDTDGWPIPTDTEAATRVEFKPPPGEVQGDEIVLVPWDKPKTERVRPAVFHFGKKLFPAGNANDPVSSDELRIWYSKQATLPVTIDDTIDPTWPEQFNQLLVLEIAIYLALKDERMAELEALKAERDPWARLYIAHLEHYVTGERRATGSVRMFLTNTHVPLASLFAGGANLSTRD